jgi:hypothetical protein
MKKIFVIIFILTASLLFCQQIKNTVFAPFVSRLKASPEGTQIILTWKNSRDVQGKKLIYRYTKEITDADFKQAELIATVGQDVESYTDSPKHIETEYYYAVLIQDKNGQVYTIFIPYRNKTTTPAVIALTGPEQKNAAVVSKLKAEVNHNKVILNFASSKSGRTLILYRSTQPIHSAADILKASFSQTLNSSATSFTDVPIAGVDYYYALLDVELVKTGEVALTVGQNTLKEPVQIPISASTLGIPKSYKRAFPLPALNILWGIETGVELETPKPLLLPNKKPLKAATVSAVQALTTSMEKFSVVEPRVEILSVDKTENAGGDSNTLKTIINTSLVSGHYAESELQLKGYLNTRHTPELEARTHYYLAQAYYFQQQYKRAFLEFLLAENFYYTDVQPWLDICFKKINSGGF